MGLKLLDQQRTDLLRRVLGEVQVGDDRRHTRQVDRIDTDRKELLVPLFLDRS